MISDNELAVIAKTDEDAFAELALRYRAMIRYLAYNRFAPGLQRSDLEQVALVGLWGAVRNYDPERGRFGVLAETAVRRQLDTTVKTALRGKHQILNEARRVAWNVEDTDMVDAIDMVAVDSSDPLAILIAREEFATVVRVVLEDCTELERNVATGQMDGESYLETAMRLGLSHTHRPDGRARSKPVDNALSRVKLKVLQALREAA